MRIGYLLVLASLAAVPSNAQSPSDPRLQSVPFDDGHVVPIKVAVGYEATVELAPDEHIENLAVGDAGAWQITPNKRGDHIFIKALQAGVVTNLTVITDARAYAFDLIPLNSPSPDTAYILRFTYASPPLNVAGPASSPARYLLAGKRQLRPILISDDGHKTRLRWGPDQSLPAIFTVDENGQEHPADGAMRDGDYVIDSVADHLIFRLDQRVATAQRVLMRGPRH